MGSSNIPLTQNRLKELLSYDPDTGVFTRNFNSSHGKAGSVAGYSGQHNYWRVWIDRKKYLGHRIAWLYVYGNFPVGDLDHINGDTSDNSIANLRDVTHKTNMQNRHGPTKLNRSGFAGVMPNHKRWQAQIRIDKKNVYLGTFDTPEEAHAAYLEAKRKSHQGCTV